jgi:glutamine synthetase adenylyltransferase
LRKYRPRAYVFDHDSYCPWLKSIKQATTLRLCVTDICRALPVQKTAAEFAEATERVLIEHVLAIFELLCGALA